MSILEKKSTKRNYPCRYHHYMVICKNADLGSLIGASSFVVNTPVSHRLKWPQNLIRNENNAIVLYFLGIMHLNDRYCLPRYLLLLHIITTVLRRFIYPKKKSSSINIFFLIVFLVEFCHLPLIWKGFSPWHLFLFAHVSSSRAAPIKRRFGKFFLWCPRSNAIFKFEFLVPGWRSLPPKD